MSKLDSWIGAAIFIFGSFYISVYSSIDKLWTQEQKKHAEKKNHLSSIDTIILDLW